MTLVYLFGSGSMKLIKATTALVLVLGAAQLFAADGARAQTTLTASQIQALLTTNYACGSSGTEKWDEILIGGASGDVNDYKKGPSDPVDPSAKVGIYTINANDTITYNYGSGGTYTYSIVTAGATAGSPGTYSFVGPSTWTISVQASACP